MRVDVDFKKIKKCIKTIFDTVPRKDYELIKKEPYTYVVDRLIKENTEYGTAPRFTIMVTGNEKKVEVLKKLYW